MRAFESLLMKYKIFARVDLSNLSSIFLPVIAACQLDRLNNKGQTNKMSYTHNPIASYELIFCM